MGKILIDKYSMSKAFSVVDFINDFIIKGSRQAMQQAIQLKKMFRHQKDKNKIEMVIKNLKKNQNTLNELKRRTRKD
jgi:hypothetical protein